MRAAGLYKLIFVFLTPICARADDELPKQLRFDRYRGMLDHSPFAVASAVAVPVATPSFAKDLFVANAARSPDGDMVTIASSSEKDFKKYLTTKNPVDGYAIVSVDWSDRVGETKVTISKDGQSATLTFNQTLLIQPLPNKPQPAVVLPSPQQPGFKPGQPPAVARPTVPLPTTFQRNPQPPNPPP